MNNDLLCCMLLDQNIVIEKKLKMVLLQLDIYHLHGIMNAASVLNCRHHYVKVETCNGITDKLQLSENLHVGNLKTSRF